MYTVYSRPLKSFIFSLIKILFSLPSGPHPISVSKSKTNQLEHDHSTVFSFPPSLTTALVLCHFLVLGMTDVSALPLSRMFDNLLVLDQNPDLRASVSSVHVAPDQSNSIMCVR